MKTKLSRRNQRRRFALLLAVPGAVNVYRAATQSITEPAHVVADAAEVGSRDGLELSEFRARQHRLQAHPRIGAARTRAAASEDYFLE